MKILTENAEYTSRKKAEEYLLKYGFIKSEFILQNYGNNIEDEKKAIDYYLRIFLRNKINSLRSTKGGKYLFGCVRIIHDEGLDKKDYSKLNEIVKIISKDEDLYKNINYNFNDMSFEDLYNKTKDYITKYYKDNTNTIKKLEKHKNSDYKVVLIDTFKQSEEYEEYVDWCICASENLYNDYRNEGLRTIYFLLREGFESLGRFNSSDELSDNALDSYGTSMICVIVDENGHMTDSVTRYNNNLKPPSGDIQHAFTKEDIEKLLDCKFENVFIPHPENLMSYYEKFYYNIKDDLESFKIYYKNNFTDEDNFIDEVGVSGTDLKYKQYRIDTTENRNLYKVLLLVFSYDDDCEWEYEIIYDSDSNEFLNDWCSSIMVYDNIIVQCNLDKTYTLLKIDDGKEIKTNKIVDNGRYKNTLFLEDPNGFITLINSKNYKIYKTKTYFERFKFFMNTDIAGLSVASNVNENETKWLLFDCNNFKPYTDGYLYSKKFMDRYGIHSLPFLGESSYIFSLDKDFENNYIFNLRTNKKLKIPFYGKDMIYRKCTLILNKKLNKSVLINLKTTEIIDEYDTCDCNFNPMSSDVPFDEIIVEVDGVKKRYKNI